MEFHLFKWHKSNNLKIFSFIEVRQREYILVTPTCFDKMILVLGIAACMR